MGCTGASTDKARQYLQVTNWSLDEAVALFFESGDQPGQGSNEDSGLSVNGRGMAASASTT